MLSAAAAPSLKQTSYAQVPVAEPTPSPKKAAPVPPVKRAQQGQAPQNQNAQAYTSTPVQNKTFKFVAVAIAVVIIGVAVVHFVGGGLLQPAETVVAPAAPAAPAAQSPAPAVPTPAQEPTQPPAPESEPEPTPPPSHETPRLAAAPPQSMESTSLIAGSWRRDNPESAWHNIIVNVDGAVGTIVDTAGVSTAYLNDTKWRNIASLSENTYTLLDYWVLDTGGMWIEMQVNISSANPNVMHLNRADGVTALPGHSQRWVRVGSAQDVPPRSQAPQPPENIGQIAGSWRRDNPNSAWHNVVVNVSANGTVGVIVDTAGVNTANLNDTKWRSITRLAENTYTLLDYWILDTGGMWIDMRATISPTNPNVLYLNRADGVTTLPGYSQRWVRIE